MTDLQLSSWVYWSSYTTQVTFPSPTDDCNEKYFDLYATTNIGFGERSISRRKTEWKKEGRAEGGGKKLLGHQIRALKSEGGKAWHQRMNQI